MTSGTVLEDGQGRRITYLRLSLTDRCNFRCSYCSAAGDEPPPYGTAGDEPPPYGAAGDEPRPYPAARGDALSRADLARLVRVFAQLGVRRVRLTGGEPTLRKDLLEVIRDVRSTPGIEEVALTTNGHLLAGLAGPLRDAGVSRLNVSLDTLDPARLREIAGRAATLDRIVSGIEAAFSAGFASVKLNVVVIGGVNDGELGDLARFAWRFGATARFIELMPFGPGRPVSTAEVKRLLEAQGVRLEADATRGWGPAYHMRGTSRDSGQPVSGLVGFIGAMTESFCDGCNRVRVAADGTLRACLGGRERLPLGELLASGAGDDDIGERIRAALRVKRDRHAMGDGGGGLPSMIRTGG